VVTITASMHKIFSPVPSIGYFAQNRAFSEALAAGETQFGTATSVEAMQAVVRNTMIQGVLSIVFVSLAIVVILTATWATWKAFRSGRSASSEEPGVPSRIFAPAGWVATPAEKELERQWDALPSGRPLASRGSH
jgi:carbon starvation protein